MSQNEDGTVVGRLLGHRIEIGKNAVLMIPVSLAPWRLGLTGAVYVVPATALSGYTIRFARILRSRSEDESRKLARDLLKVSVLYLPLLFTTLMLCAIAKS